MSFRRPTIRQLIARCQSDLKTTVDRVNALLRETFEYVLAVTIGGMTHSLHGHLFWASRQAFASTAEEAGVREWSFILDLPARDPDFAVGTVNFTGVATTPIPEGTQWQRSDGVVFETVDALVIGGGGTVSGEVQAVVEGDAGNTEGATPLTIVSPITGVNADATVDGDGLVGGVDAEDVESLRERVLFRMANTPAGGNVTDYIGWAKEVSGVTRAWCYPNGLGAGTVVVYFATDNEVSPIPDPTKVQEVQDYIDSVRPAIGELTVAAPTAYTVNLTIAIDPDTSDVQDATEEALDDYFKRFGSSDQQIPTMIPLSQIDEVISQVPDEDSHTVSVPAADVTLTTGQIPVLGTVTWV